LAALYFSWQAERNRFGGICFWTPLFTYWNRIKAPTPPDDQLSLIARKVPAGQEP
jgi:hypothetical protein